MAENGNPDSGNSVRSYTMAKDYHSMVLSQLEDAVSVQGGAQIKRAKEKAKHPNYVSASFQAYWLTQVSLDSRTSEVITRSGVGIGEKNEKFPAPTQMGLVAIAECYNDDVEMSASEVPTSSIALSEDKLQIAVPDLVRNTVLEAQKRGSDADKWLKQQPLTTKQHYMYTGGPHGDFKAYMQVQFDPTDVAVRNRMEGALSTLKEKIEIELPDVKYVKANFIHTKRFNAGYSIFSDDDMHSIDQTLKWETKDSRLALEVEAELKSGTKARVMAGGTGGLEGLTFARLNTSNSAKHHVELIHDFDECVDAIADSLVEKIKAKDQGNDIRHNTQLGNKAPVVLSAEAAGYLIYAVTMFSSGTMMFDQMRNGDSNYLKKKIGTEILPDEFNIIVNGDQVQRDGLNNRYGSQLVDVEGTPVRPVQIVENGRLVMPLVTRETILPILDDSPLVRKKVKGKINGSSRPQYEWTLGKGVSLPGVARMKDYASDIVAAPTNIDLLTDANGPVTVEGLVEKIQKDRVGLYVQDVSSVSIDSKGNITMKLDLGYLIANGGVNKEVIYNSGSISLQYDDLAAKIIGMSGPGTAIPTAMDAQVAPGQILPVSVSSPMIAISEADFTAQAGGKGRFGSYVNSLDRDPYAFEKKIAGERIRGYETRGEMILTATNGIARVAENRAPTKEIVLDVGTSKDPAYTIKDRELVRK